MCFISNHVRKQWKQPFAYLQKLVAICGDSRECLYYVKKKRNCVMVEIGERVMVGRDCGVVRYVGEVDGHSGIWVGIEWDDPERGKHSGVLNGVKYFQTSSPHGGSLVNIKSVSHGIDLLTAIINRYADTVDDNNLVIGSKYVELVGMHSTSQRQSNVFQLLHIVLESCSVARPPEEPCNAFTRCISLNLFNNLLQRWKDVRMILKFFPQLRELVLRFLLITHFFHIFFEIIGMLIFCLKVDLDVVVFRKNRMEAANVDETWSEVKCLTDLVLSDCNQSSESVSNVLCYLPGLRSLYAVSNCFTYFCVPEMAHSLTNIDIGNNQIRCLSNITGNLDKLEKLSVVNCGISRIVIGSGQFPSLTTLNIKDNVISDWRSINELQALPKLSVLYINYENLHCVDGIGTHEVIIAKLQNLVDLNRFEISGIERNSAEVRFLDKYFSANQDLLADHLSDIQRLEKIHGTVNLVGSKSNGLSVVLLSICYKDSIVEKKLPLAITVQKLTELIGRMFSVESMYMRLELDKGTHQVELGNPLRSLDFYSPEKGDILRLLTT
ncbi:CAP-Gly domain protein [Dictyocaulus viviparus]|uniref:Tubulin-specific chaperone E n=1 Tax=Dictyocaulus viviparus TaxID=29172 RepID=A0A0D8XGH0_DICVI|nr:CAP-Gly domain protein [Dictyocaulus viviparus]